MRISEMYSGMVKDETKGIGIDRAALSLSNTHFHIYERHITIHFSPTPVYHFTWSVYITAPTHISMSECRFPISLLSVSVNTMPTYTGFTLSLPRFYAYICKRTDQSSNAKDMLLIYKHT